jgi:DNA repair protein RadA/Sms
VLQAAGALAHRQLKVLYVSGEESLAQVGERGRRLGVNAPDLYLAAETSLEAVVEQIGSLKPAAVIVDSIQTVWSRSLASAAGSLSQVREVAGRLTEVAKRDEVGVWLIGHVTKDGGLAGPRALEHLVDTVVYFEGDRQHSHRILRATKNRFGPTDEIGVFEMRSDGLAPVDNPSALFLAERPPHATGCIVVATLEGTRPILLELQALVTPTGAAVPRRVANGLDYQRVAMLLAVLEKRLDVRLATADVFLNVVGGLEIPGPPPTSGCWRRSCPACGTRRSIPAGRSSGRAGWAGRCGGYPRRRSVCRSSPASGSRGPCCRGRQSTPSGDPPLEVTGLSHAPWPNSCSRASGRRNPV